MTDTNDTVRSVRRSVTSAGLDFRVGDPLPSTEFINFDGMNVGLRVGQEFDAGPFILRGRTTTVSIGRSRPNVFYPPFIMDELLFSPHEQQGTSRLTFKKTVRKLTFGTAGQGFIDAYSTDDVLIKRTRIDFFRAPAWLTLESESPRIAYLELTGQYKVDGHAGIWIDNMTIDY